jgi:hypothetical protein
MQGGGWRLIPIFFRGAFVNMEYPSELYAYAGVEARFGVGDASVEVSGTERHGARGKTEDSAVGIETPVRVHVPIPDEARDVTSPR